MSIETLQRELDAAKKTNEHLMSKIYTLQLANIHLLRVIKDICDMLYDKWTKDDERN